MLPLGFTGPQIWSDQETPPPPKKEKKKKTRIFSIPDFLASFILF